MDMQQVLTDLQARVDEPIKNHGFFMSKGSFTKLPSGMTSGFGKMLGGLRRKQSGGDLSGTTTAKAVWGLDNHQTALVLTENKLFAIDTTTSMSRQMTIGDLLSEWNLNEITITGNAKSRPGDVMLLNLDIVHNATGQQGHLETMAYTNLGDPSWDCYNALINNSGA